MPDSASLTCKLRAISLYLEQNLQKFSNHKIDLRWNDYFRRYSIEYPCDKVFRHVT